MAKLWIRAASGPSFDVRIDVATVTKKMSPCRKWLEFCRQDRCRNSVEKNESEPQVVRVLSLGWIDFYEQKLIVGQFLLQNLIKQIIKKGILPGMTGHLG